ncbi:MAG: hypothetical protein J6R59_01125 [Paludibacteraceae bacterium]|nr:hypothetical protein [Paludibacteraceae bacterium]
MNKVSRKRLRTQFKPRFIDNRKELHLLTLGIGGGGVTEKIDGQCFAVKVGDDSKILIKTARGEYDKISREPSHQALVEHLQTHMFMELLKMKRKYGAFEFEGELIYAPQEYYDADNTVTIVATKYHKVRMGNKGAVVIRKFKGNVKEEDVEFVLKELQMYFTITAHKGFKCYLIDEMIPTEDIDTVVDIPSNCELSDIPNLLDKLAESSRSLINGSIDVKGCEVEGYVFYVNGIPYAIINKRWKALKEKYLEKYTEIAELYGIYKKLERPIGYDDINIWVKKCEDFLTDKEIPKGVRFTKKERIMSMLPKLSQNIPVGDYLRFTNRLLSVVE